MEIMLAIVVSSAVIFFGVLISIGNERERKSIDSLREQIVSWAIQDLNIKRVVKADEILVENPINWISLIASRYSGTNIDAVFVDAVSEPDAIVCSSDEGKIKVILSPASPFTIKNIKRNKSGRLSLYSNGNPLLAPTRKSKTYELSVLNCGKNFDLEFAYVWKALTGKKESLFTSVWLYILRS